MICGQCIERKSERLVGDYTKTRYKHHCLMTGKEIWYLSKERLDCPKDAKPNL